MYTPIDESSVRTLVTRKGSLHIPGSILMTIPSFSLIFKRFSDWRTQAVYIKCIYSRHAPLYSPQLVQAHHPQLVGYKTRSKTNPTQGTCASSVLKRPKGRRSVEPNMRVNKSTCFLVHITWPVLTRQYTFCGTAPVATMSVLQESHTVPSYQRPPLLFQVQVEAVVLDKPDIMLGSRLGLAFTRSLSGIYWCMYHPVGYAWGLARVDLLSIYCTVVVTVFFIARDINFS
jgi:hypothetical protein